MDDKEKGAASALNKVFGYEPRIAAALIRELGSAAAVFALSEKQRNALLAPFSKYAGALGDGILENSLREAEALEKAGCRIIPLISEDYPALLRDCEDPPACLYVKSSSEPKEIFAGRPLISVVGTRDTSLYGKEWCGRIVRAMAEAPQKPCIVSGLAFGIDITAHLAALESGLPTIAVLPTGIDRIYPSAHRQAAKRIASSKGSALISDFPPETGPAAFTFLRRNRIIAGLSRSTILIESKIKGGGMITARLAASYGRDVFALPGRVDDLRSAGCNRLIREKTAEAISDLSGLGVQLGLGRYNMRRKEDLSERACLLYAAEGEELRKSLLQAVLTIKKQRGISIEELGASLGEPYPEASALARRLESDGLICIDLLGRCTIDAKNV